MFHQMFEHVLTPNLLCLLLLLCRSTTQLLHHAFGLDVAEDVELLVILVQNSMENRIAFCVQILFLIKVKAATAQSHRSNCRGLLPLKSSQ
jgi:hypothetical protein